MDERLVDFYHLSEIETFEDVHLQTLRENCAVLEESVRDMLQRLPDADCQILEAYMDMRDELEFQTVKTALRWEKSIINSDGAPFKIHWRGSAQRP